jgi:hypothetical protein
MGQHGNGAWTVFVIERNLLLVGDVELFFEWTASLYFSVP